MVRLMLKTRGYVVANAPTPSDFAAVRGDEVVPVLFRDKMGRADMRVVIDKLLTEAVLHCIIVTAEKRWSPQAGTEAADSGLWIENFSWKCLILDVASHPLVPRHVLLTAAETVAMLAAEKLDRKQLPRISVDDPVARYYGARLGQVFRVERPSETAGVAVVYRVVVVVPKPKS